MDSNHPSLAQAKRPFQVTASEFVGTVAVLRPEVKKDRFAGARLPSSIVSVGARSHAAWLSSKVFIDGKTC
jgi:hypothetical protein